MKKVLILLALLLAFTSIGLGQGSGPITVKEVDGSPVCNNCRTFVFPNGSLTVSGNKVTVATGGGGITVGTTTITSGTSGRLPYNNAGVYGEISGLSTNGSSTLTQTSASATAFESGPNGSTNPVFRLVNSTASQATGLSITGNAAGSGVTLTALSSGTNEDIILVPKGTTGRLRTTGVQGGPFITPTDATTTGFGAANGGGNPDATITISNTIYYQAKANNNSFTKQLGLGTDPNNPNVFLFTTGSNGIWRFGAADAASPVAQTLSVQSVVAGTSNTAGVNWTHNASIGTGTGVGGDYIIQTAPAGSSGTAQNSLAAAFTVKGNGAIQLKSVTFANLPTVANGYLIYCSDCTIASPCASGGTGALAKGINSAWVCN